MKTEFKFKEIYKMIMKKQLAGEKANFSTQPTTKNSNISYHINN